MIKLDSQLGKIDLSRPFAEQETVQDFLRLSPISSRMAVPNELLLRLFLVAKETIHQCIPNYNLELKGTKLGYERKVVTQTFDSQESISSIESQFVYDELWETLEQSAQEKILDENAQGFVKDLAGRITEELQRIYSVINVDAQLSLHLSVILYDSSSHFFPPDPFIYQIVTYATCKLPTGEIVEGTVQNGVCVPNG